MKNFSETINVMKLTLLRRQAEQWLNRRNLPDTVQELVRGVQWKNASIAGHAHRKRTPRSEALLAILTYCYASGIYSSQEIASRVARCAAGAGWLDSGWIQRRSLIDFRRGHRDLIEECLQRVLAEAFMPRRDSARSLSYFFTEAPERQAELRAESQRRVENAIMADCFEHET